MTNKLNRRLFLRSGSAMILLPQFEFLLGDKAIAAAEGKPTNYAQFFLANGVVGNTWNSSSINSLSSSMSPINSYGLKNESLIVQGLVNHSMGVTLAINGQAQHGVSAPSAFTGLTYHWDNRHAGAYLQYIQKGASSLDQRVAELHDTPIHSLVMSAFPSWASIRGDHRFSQAQLKHISYKDGHGVPNYHFPLQIYNLMYGSDNLGLKEVKQSILSEVMGDAKRLKNSGKLSKQDSERLDEYMEGIRTVEKRLLGIESGCSVPDSAKFEIKGERLEDVNKRGDAMMELASLAFQCGLTNAVSLMYAFEHHYKPINHFISGYGTARGHDVSHYILNNSAAAHTAMARWQVSRACKFAKMLKDTKGVDGKPLLDKTVVLLASGMGDGRTHSNRSIFMLWTGSKAFKTGKIVATSASHSNALFTVLKAFGSTAATHGHGNTVLSQLVT